MSEWRVDSLTGRTVLVAPERARRPGWVEATRGSRASAVDPFLEGNESETPEELFAIRATGTAPDAPGWTVRVVPNKFPALSLEGHAADFTLTPRQVTAGVGAHEVIVECPHFETNLGRLPVQDVVHVLRVYRERLRVHSDDVRLRFAVIFKNQGRAAGATIAHCHSQLIASEFVLPGAARQRERARDYFEAHGRSLYEDIIREEVEHGVRVVSVTDDMLVWCPLASRFSYETRILPLQPVGRFEAATDEQLESLAAALKATLWRLEKALDDPPLNYILHTAPFREPELPGDRWWFEVIPRVTGVGGFEWGSDCSITSVAPEDAARLLRDDPSRTVS